jgi:hypothetical protein
MTSKEGMMSLARTTITSALYWRYPLWLAPERRTPIRRKK